MMQYRWTARAALVLAAACLMVGCAGRRDVSFTINSEPPGAFVVFHLSETRKRQGADWIYLGTTPLVVERELNLRQVKREAVTLRVMKEGYFEQQKQWTGAQLIREWESKGGISWSPHLVHYQGAGPR